MNHVDKATGTINASKLTVNAGINGIKAIWFKQLS